MHSTETEDGNILLICDSNGKYLDHPNITFEKVTEFLFKYEGKWAFFWDLGYDATCMLKLLPRTVLDSYTFTIRLYDIDAVFR